MRVRLPEPKDACRDECDIADARKNTREGSGCKTGTRHNIWLGVERSIPESQFFLRKKHSISLRLFQDQFVTVIVHSTLVGS